MLLKTESGMNFHHTKGALLFFETGLRCVFGTANCDYGVEHEVSPIVAFVCTLQQSPQWLTVKA